MFEEDCVLDLLGVIEDYHKFKSPTIVLANSREAVTILQKICLGGYTIGQNNAIHTHCHGLQNNYCNKHLF
jgi:hypothetical protein